MSQKHREMWDKGVPLRDAFIDYYGFPNHKMDEQAQKTKSDYLQLSFPAEQGDVDPHHPEWHRYQPKGQFDVNKDSTCGFK